MLYLAIKTRPDILYAVNRLSQYTSNPGDMQFKELNKLWGYIKQYPDLVIEYNCNLDQYILNKDNIKALSLKGYCDSDWASNLDNRRSQSAYIFLFGNNIIS